MRSLDKLPPGFICQTFAVLTLLLNKLGVCTAYCDRLYTVFTEHIVFVFLSGLGIRSFQKNGAIFVFFFVLYKRMERSLHSFPFFIKELNVFCVLFHSL